MMATKAIPPGPVGRRFGARLRELRRAKNLDQPSLAKTLKDDVGREIPVSSISRLENGERRVDADDLVALAVALAVAPSRLLLPDGQPGDMVHLTEKVTVPWERAWAWAAGDRSLDSPHGPVPIDLTDPKQAAEAMDNQAANQWAMENAPHQQHYLAPLGVQEMTDHIATLVMIKNAVEEAAQQIPASLLHRWLHFLAAQQRFGYPLKPVANDAVQD